MISRRNTKEIKIGNIAIGGKNKITVETMLKVPHTDYNAVISQIADLKRAGCDILRLAIVNMDCISLIYKLKELAAIDTQYALPLVADIHFDHRLAIESVYAGIDMVRINPGNIGSENYVEEITRVCKAKSIPIRVGVNGGSLERTILNNYGKPTAQALAESALYNVSLLEKFDFCDIVVAAKSSEVNQMICANLLIAQNCNYPMHIGVTEAGPSHTGLIKSAIGIGGLLQRGIGDTIRVSLTSSSSCEVYEGAAILKTLGMRKSIDIVSCPTCGRCRVALHMIVSEVESRLIALERDMPEGRNIKVAVMGCAVNGPGEAKEADVGISGGQNEFLLFRKGIIVKKVSEKEAVNVLIDEVEKIISDMSVF